MEKKFIILIGCPCSGKSTFAEAYKKEHPYTEIANRDTIRYMIGKGEYKTDSESDVTKIEENIVRDAMKIGKTVILDDTNLNPKYLPQWYSIAEEFGYTVETKKFYVPFAVAMERSKKRRDEGGLFIPRKVMEHFYRTYFKEEFEKEMTDYRVSNIAEWKKNLPTCVICDLDGTYAMHTGRTPFEWNRLQEDQVDTRLNLLLEIVNRYDCEVIFLTGRPDSVREETAKWLEKHFDGENYSLIMRDKDDFSHGDDVKQRLYEKHIKDKYNVLAVFEDSNKCVAMWRRLGLLTLQVQNGDY